MTEKELLYDIRRELTYAKALPFSLPDEELQYIVKIASRYFYDNWRYACEERYLVLPLAIFKDPVFKKFRTITMPNCVNNIHQFQEIKGGSMFGTIDRDFSDSKFLGSEVFLTPMMGESIVYRMAVFSFLDLTQNMVLNTIAYDYNKNTKRLFVKGHDPKMDAIAICAWKIEPEFLYEDEVFQRYCRAKAKLRLSDMMSTMDFNLPGAVKLNFAAVTANAQKESDNIEKQMSSETLPNFMLFDRG